MSSLKRSLADDAMLFDLGEEIETARAVHPPAQAGRTARTLLKNGPLRVTLILMQAGGEIADHSAPGPITIHVVRGSIRLTIAGQEHRINAGQIVGAAAGVRHAVAADEEAAFLLTVVQPERGN